MAKKKPSNSNGSIAQNRRARFDYIIEDDQKKDSTDLALLKQVLADIIHDHANAQKFMRKFLYFATGNEHIDFNKKINIIN